MEGDLHLEVDPSIQPTQVAARRIPVAMREPLKAELSRLEAMDVIERVNEPTDWTLALSTIHKQDGSLRICIDPQQLNRALKRQASVSSANS